jgi:protein-tyrosine phosphatase
MSKKRKLEHFDKICSRVTDYLYVGGQNCAQDWEALSACGITHVVNCTLGTCPNAFEDRGIKYFSFHMDDSPAQQLMCIAFQVIEFISAAREAGGRIFVHCTQGVSRGPSCCIAYLIWLNTEPYEDVRAFVRSCRGIVSPNVGFAAQLMKWSSLLVKEQQSSLPRVYMVAPLSINVPHGIQPTLALKLLDPEQYF